MSCSGPRLVTFTRSYPGPRSVSSGYPFWNSWVAFCRNKLLVSETLKTSAQFAYPMNCVDELRCSTRLGKKYFDIRLTPRCSEQNSPEKYDGWELLWVVSLISQSLCFNRNLYRGNLSACQAPSLIRRSRHFRYPCAPLGWAERTGSSAQLESRLWERRSRVMRDLRHLLGNFLEEKVKARWWHGDI